jgi:osmotically-inducible protein OsmY
MRDRYEELEREDRGPFRNEQSWMRREPGNREAEDWGFQRGGDDTRSWAGESSGRWRGHEFSGPHTGGQYGGQYGGSQRSGSQYGGSQQYGGSPHGGQRSGGTYGGDYPARQQFFEHGGQQSGSWDEPYGRPMRGTGRFAGKGPKGYQRSDERIREDISDRLTDDGDIDPSDVEVMVANGEVTLIGSVESRQVRRAVEDLVEFVPGVRDIRNELKVSRGGDGHGEDTSHHASYALGSQGSASSRDRDPSNRADSDRKPDSSRAR